MHREQAQPQPRSKAWETTIRKTQLQRLGCSFFAGTSVAPLDENGLSKSTDTEYDVDSIPDGQADRRFSNGDFYTGAWLSDRPHGTGKYLWTDGCIYEGEWVDGKTTGQGKFFWPTGATYEGDFKSGYIDGFGTFTSSNGDSYCGCYSMNLKQGHGSRTYTNGDVYAGEWKYGLRDGSGRYIWRDQHEYTGEFKSGIMSGKGNLIWSNGNSYDGCWEDGSPSGKGQFRWSDGSLYVGFWSKDPTLRKGVVYPPSPDAASIKHLPQDPQEALMLEFNQCRVSQEDNSLTLPSQKMDTFTIGAGFKASELEAAIKPAKIKNKLIEFARLNRRSSVDSSMRGRRNMRRSGSADNSYDKFSGWDGDCDSGRDERMTSEDSDTRTRSPIAGLVPRDLKKQGVTISKGHKNYELMLNLQLGIRHSVARPAPAISLNLKSSAFDPKEKLWTKFPPEGSKSTPPHQSCEFKWKDYCPVVFRTLRMLFNVDPADYMISICGNDALRELSSPGKSGSFFYLTHDDRYMIKTIKKSEVKVLLRMLPAYYNHVRSYENTLVTKFFGLHCVKLTGAIQKKVRFVIMGNLFCSEYTIHRHFDLKGSSHGRMTDKPESEIDASTTLKDLDLNFIFRLQGSWFQEFCKQVDQDCELLEQERIMDYSLLVGLHFRESSLSNNDPFLIEGSSDSGSAFSEETPTLSRAKTDSFFTYPRHESHDMIKLGINMPSQVEKTARNDCDSLIGEPTGEIYDVILFFGIIDILQDYDISKKLEHAIKAFQYDATSISAVDPKLYSKRFRDFIFKVFTRDTEIQPTENPPG